MFGQGISKEGDILGSAVANVGIVSKVRRMVSPMMVTRLVRDARMLKIYLTQSIQELMESLDKQIHCHTIVY
ncbi:MAG: hypothetical protein ACLSGB_13680 [Dorea sp.]